jgi:hypothetical protein
MTLAPSDPTWHELYCETMHHMFEDLSRLQNHPAYKDSEDLGDWIEALHTLLSFRPQTDATIEATVRERLFG